MPCNATELVHFRKRIGVKGFNLIFKMSVALHGKQAQGATVLIDTTVQASTILLISTKRTITNHLRLLTTEISGHTLASLSRILFAPTNTIAVLVLAYLHKHFAHDKQNTKQSKKEPYIVFRSTYIKKYVL
jgi:hypothetical protein